MPQRPTITQKLEKLGVSKYQFFEVPLWKGPVVDGVTQSMLNYFLGCRERFRLAYIEGWQTPDQFDVRIEYGQMWHLCEEVWAKDHSDDKSWRTALSKYASDLTKKYPTQTSQVSKWFNVCRVQFPIYVDYWRHHPHTLNRRPLLEEVCFRVPYQLPSGVTVLLRGKWDSVELISIGAKRQVWLQDNKTKYDLQDEKLRKQLDFDLQSMFYLVALRYALENKQYTALANLPAKWLRGIRYNVIKRPLSGGKGTIKQLGPTKAKPQGESLREYYDRLGGIIKDNPEEFFARWEVEVLHSDIERFEKRVLVPILQQLVEWYEFMQLCEFDPWKVDQRLFDCELCERRGHAIHWQHPYGTYNILNEGGSTEFDEYFRTGSTLRLERATKLFTELDD